MAKLPDNVVRQLARGATGSAAELIETHMLRHPQRYGLTTGEIEGRCLSEDRGEELHERVEFAFRAALVTLEL